MPRPWRPTPHGIALISFFVSYLVLLRNVRHWSYRDPSSVFFDPERAFERKYSLERESQAETWIYSIGKQSSSQYVKASQEPSLCVGIATVQREGANYFRRTVGSVLAGLTEKERKDIFLVSFFADVDPKVHQAYHESWVSVVSDQILTVPEDVLASVRELVHSDIYFDHKPLYDYIYLLRNCYSRGAPYVVILEDDVIAADGWYYRTKTALEAWESKPDFAESLYLRLFYNERILGWNSEEWTTYLIRVVMVEALVLGILVAVRRYVPRASPTFTSRTIATICLLVTPLCIWFYFAAGRLTVSPLPRGVQRMDTYGCCSQALVFPRGQVPGLTKALEELNIGKADSLVELYASEYGLARWALTPSVFAHVGSTGSRGSYITRWNRSNVENIWNFSFELFDAEKLKDEHVIMQSG